MSAISSPTLPALHSPPSLVRPALATVVAFAALLLWDASGLDMVLARWVGTPWGFPWRENAFLTVVMHQGGKTLSWLAVFVLLALVRWPAGPWRRLSRAQRWQLALVPLVAVLVVTLMKKTSSTSCPWDLQAFGGVAPWVSHWALGVRDGGGAHCFPAGHASAAFCFLGGWFVWRAVSERFAAIWLTAALLLGLALGVSQQLRGAHFTSHTLWSAWVCWVAGLAVECAVRAWPRIRVALRFSARPALARVPNPASAADAAKLNES